MPREAIKSCVFEAKPIITLHRVERIKGYAAILGHK